MKVKNPRVEMVYGEGTRLSLLLEGKDSEAEARRFVDRNAQHQKEMIYEATLKVYREKRSLTANAYFHVLCSKIAAELRTDIDAVKKRMVRMYGCVADSDDGYPITVTVPKGVNIEAYYPYVEWMYGDATADVYMLLKQTHLMNTAEFARLIDGVVDEAKRLGIETLPPEELERLYAQIDKNV